MFLYHFCFSKKDLHWSTYKLFQFYSLSVQILKRSMLEMLLQKKPLNMMYPTTIFINYLKSVSIHLIPKRKFHLLSSKYCKDLNVKVIFSPFKLCNIFSPKDFIPDYLKSYVVNKFTSVGRGSRYVGETNRDFYTRVNEHLFGDKNSHIFKHLGFSKNCQDNCDVSCFKIIDNATSFYELKIKESFHIERLKPELNKQVDLVSLALHF